MSYDLIREAILEKKIIHATYRGQHREMCPHVLGRKNGKPQALFYQFGGESNSRPIQPDGSPDNWRCLELALLSDVRIVEGGDWHTAPNHSRPQTCVGEIDVTVGY